MAHLFEGDEYHTEARVARPALVRCFGWSRLPFYWYASVLVRRGRREALEGVFTDERFITHAEGIIRAVERCGGRVDVTGMRHLSAIEGPVVLIGNHMSFLETFILPAMVLPRKPLSFVVKESLVTHPVIGPILSTQAPVALTRRHAREDLRTLMREGKARIEAGRSVCVFPQSTRMTEFRRDQFNSIGAKLAQRAERPILPVALKTDFLGNGRVIKDLGPVDPGRDVHVAFGAPIDSGHAKRAQNELVQFLIATLSGWNVPCI